VLAPALAAADKRDFDDVPNADKATPLQDLSPAQQWWRGRNTKDWGYGGKFGLLVLADELGDKLAETGRISMISRCLGSAQPEAASALAWAVCGPDVKAFDIKKFEQQLAVDNLSPDVRQAAVKEVQEIIDKAKKVGEGVEAAAKDDPGVAAILKAGEQGRSEWAAYVGKNKETYARYLALKDGVRSGKSNHKNFAGCWEQTFPAFSKLVKATKFPWEVSGDYMPAYMTVMLTSPESYITATSFAACAYSVDEAGEALYASAANQSAGVIRSGPRTTALAKLLDQSLKPKFAERALSIDSMRSSWSREWVKVDGINDISKMMTPAQGTVATAKPDGDVTKITFKGDTVDACLEWKTTNRIQSYGANGDPMYEKVCKKRGQVANQESATEISTKFAAGIKPGVDVLIVYKFPVTTWQKGKFVSVFGVPCPNCR
jgi:hypothetical protein